MLISGAILLTSLYSDEVVPSKVTLIFGELIDKEGGVMKSGDEVSAKVGDHVFKAQLSENEVGQLYYRLTIPGSAAKNAASKIEVTSPFDQSRKFSFSLDAKTNRLNFKHADLDMPEVSLIGLKLLKNTITASDGSEKKKISLAGEYVLKANTSKQNFTKFTCLIYGIKKEMKNEKEKMTLTKIIELKDQAFENKKINLDVSSDKFQNFDGFKIMIKPYYLTVAGKEQLGFSCMAELILHSEDEEL